MRSHWTICLKSTIISTSGGGWLCLTLVLGSVSAWVDEDVTVIHADIIFRNMFTRPEVIFAEVFLPFGCPESGFNLVEESAS